MTDHDFFASGDVGGYTGKRDGQFVEVDLFLIADAQIVEKVDQCGVVDISARQIVCKAFGFVFALAQVLDDPRQAEGDIHEHGAVALPHFGCHGRAIDGVAYVFRPIHVSYKLGEFVGRIAQGIEASDDGSHAGASHVVYWDPDFLNIFQYADMGGAFGAATTEHHAHLGAWCVNGNVFLVLCFCRDE